VFSLPYTHTVVLCLLLSLPCRLLSIFKPTLHPLTIFDLLAYPVATLYHSERLLAYPAATLYSLAYPTTTYPVPRTPLFVVAKSRAYPGAAAAPSLPPPPRPRATSRPPTGTNWALRIGLVSPFVFSAKFVCMGKTPGRLTGSSLPYTPSL
jgi:hypothetical protein